MMIRSSLHKANILKRVMTVFFVLVVLMHFKPASGGASEAPMINGFTKMASGTSQPLSIMNYQTGITYFWTLESGGGSLTSVSGERVVYTAPVSNENCTNNPVIRVTDSSGKHSEIQIAINGYDGISRRAFKKVEMIGPCHEVQDGMGFWHLSNPIECSYYNCDGSLYSGPCNAGGPLPESEEQDCVNASKYHWCWAGNFSCSGAEGEGIHDVRATDMKQQGCCPEELLFSYEPPKTTPENIYSGEDPSAKPPVCEKSKVGNPVSVYSGNNFESQKDLVFPSPGGSSFVFKRSYNSKNQINNEAGYGWVHNYRAALNMNYSYEGKPYLQIFDDTGRGVYFEDQGGGYYTGAFKEQTYVNVENGNYIWYRLDGRRFVFNSGKVLIRIEELSGNSRLLIYDGDNRLASVTDEAGGRTITFHYNSDNKLESVSGPITQAVPDGIWVHYGYDTNDNLVSVTYADGSGFEYEYNDPADIHNLTAKRDKQGHLLSSWTYDSQDRAITSFTRDGKGVDIFYVNQNEVRVADAYGVSRTYAIWDIDGRKKVTDITGPSNCGSCRNGIVRIEYDGQARVVEVEYANGLINQYNDFDRRGNARIVTQAVGTPDEKTIVYTFHPDIAVKLSRKEPSLLSGGNKITIWDYDNDGNASPNENPTRRLYRLIERGFTEDAFGQVVPYERNTAYTYNDKGQVLSVDGPQPGTQDTTIFSYDDSSPASGLLGVVRPLIGTVTYSDYDGAGQAGRISEQNGHTIALTYDGRGRIRTVTSESDNSVATYSYNTAGELGQVMAANGITIDYEYDPTYGRLVRMHDPLGNHMSYDYDAQGNRIDQSVYTAANDRDFWQRFDYRHPQNPGKLWKVINPDGTYTEYSYFAGGNILSVKDPTDKITDYDYNIFNQLTSVSQPGRVVTLYGYDQNGNLKTVTDAQDLTTRYKYDDLGRLISTVSPDTGLTTYAYDISGNLISKTDAKGITSSYTYDTLNRLSEIIYADSAQNIAYIYDEGTNGKGRLTGIRDPSGNIAFDYDVKGNLVSETRVVAGVAYTTDYTYDSAGTLTGMTYPDGRSIAYELDSAGRVGWVTLTKDGTTQVLADDISYRPFGPMAGLTYGNGTNLVQNFDLLYRPADISAGSVYSVDFTKDAAGNITAIANLLDTARDQAFGYDDLYRLTSADGIYGTIGYTYDNVGNRLTRTIDGQVDTYSYEPGTNRLFQINGANPQSFTLDANGNPISMGPKTLFYNQNNRLIQVVENSNILTDYTYNGLGQRAVKGNAIETTIYLYDLFGNLIAESESDGTIIAEYFYLNGRRLATIRANEKIEAIVDVEPHTLNLNSNASWVSAVIELPEGYDVKDIDTRSIILNGIVRAMKCDTGDNNENGLPDLRVKFDRVQVCDILPAGSEVEITVEGKGGGFVFFGVDHIRVTKRGKRNKKSSLSHGSKQ